mgnify:CR=1 FL=1
MTIASGQQALAADILKHATADGYLQLTDSTVLTIATGAVTATANFYRIDTESAAASDDLDTITAGTGVADGHLLVIRPANDARTVVVKHNTGNIVCANGVSQTLDDAHDTLILFYDSNLTKWVVAGFLGPLTVNTGSLAADSVDDTKAGDRVPQFYRRQGGSATDWSTVGTTDRTPTSVRMQGGSVTVPASSTVIVTFPVAFSNVPLCYATATSHTTPVRAAGTASTVTLANSLGVDIQANWLAIGPE